MGDKGLSVFLTNLFAQNTSLVSAGMGLPTIEATVINPNTGAASTPGASANDLLGAVRAEISRGPLTGNIERDFQRIASVLPNLRISISTPLGTETFILPRGASLADLQSILASLSSAMDPAAMLNTFQSENPAAAVLTLGSHSVYGQDVPRAQTAQGNHQPLSAQGERLLLPNAEGHATPSSSSSNATVHTPSDAPARAGASVPASANRASIKIPEVVRDVLIQLRLLPPGVSTEQALPRLQEVMRLWNAGTIQHSDISPEVARVVSQFFASAALAMATTNPQGAATPLRAQPGAAAQTNASGNGLSPQGSPAFGEGAARPGFRFGALTRGDIASAVMTALAGTSMAPTMLPNAAPARPGQPMGSEMPASGNSMINTSAGHSTIPAKPGDKDAAAGRLADGARLESGVQIRETRTPSSRLSGDEHRERDVSEGIELQEGRAAHDQETFAGSGGQEDALASAEIEAVWKDLHAALERGGFVHASGSIRPLLDAVEGRSFLRVLASRVPDGLDLIDMLALVENRIGFAPESGGVNAALRRLANHRMQGHGKGQALLEPLRDAFVVLDMIDADLMPIHEAEISKEDLKGFEIQASFAQLVLDNSAWMARMGMTAEDRADLARLLPDVERTIENAHEKFAEQIAVSDFPEYFRDTVPALPH